MIRLKTWLVLVVLVSSAFPWFAQSTTLKIVGNLEDNNCEISALTPTINLGSHLPAEFSANSGTAVIRTVRFRIFNCNMPDNKGGTFYVTLTAGGGTVVSGTGDVANAVFTNSITNTTGFMFRPVNHTPPGDPIPEWTTVTGRTQSDYYSATDLQKMINNHPEGLGSFGHHPYEVDDGDIINFAVGFVQVDMATPPSVERVSATVILTVTYV